MTSTLTLTSSHLSVEIAPDLGGRVLSLREVGGREWMWRNPLVSLAPRRLGDVYDDNWVGGFEELFPNDAPTELDDPDLILPDHGELWSTGWKVVNASSSQDALLETVGPVTGVRIRKEFRLDGPSLDVTYELHNQGPRDLPYLFKLHPAIVVTSQCRLQLPGGTVERVDPTFSKLLTSDRHAWPGPPGEDISICHPPTSGLREFVYVSELPEGWCAVVDHERRTSLRLSYALDSFPYCWLFLSYGGFRKHQVAVLEPCTNYPKDLRDAIALGTAPVLEAGQTREFAVTLKVGVP